MRRNRSLLHRSNAHLMLVGTDFLLRLTHLFVPRKPPRKSLLHDLLHTVERGCFDQEGIGLYLRWKVEAMGLEPTNLLTASQALYQLSYAPSGGCPR